MKVANKDLPHCTIHVTRRRSSCLHLSPSLTGAGSRQLAGAAVRHYCWVSCKKSSESVQNESKGGFLQLLLIEALCWTRATFCFTWSLLSLLSTLADEGAEWSSVHYLFMDFSCFSKAFCRLSTFAILSCGLVRVDIKGQLGLFAKTSREFLLFLPQ